MTTTCNAELKIVSSPETLAKASNPETFDVDVKEICLVRMYQKTILRFHFPNSDE